jgi:hypothetical protein
VGVNFWNLGQKGRKYLNKAEQAIAALQTHSPPSSPVIDTNILD